MTLISRKFFLSRSRMLEFLRDIEQTSDIGAISVYMPPSFLAPEFNEALHKVEAHSIHDELSQLTSGAKNGAVLFWGDRRKCLVLPPFPVSEKTTFSGYVAEPLRRLLSIDFMIGLVLVHLGSYAIGICQGEKLISSKVGTGLVHGQHRQGGWSQQRFQRRRENQARKFLDRVCLHIQEHLEPRTEQLNYIVYGGPRQTLLQLQKRCPFLRSLEDRVLPLLDVPLLRQRVLETTVGRVWSSCIIDWQDEYNMNLIVKNTSS